MSMNDDLDDFDNSVSKWFVMMTNSNGQITPLIDEEDEHVLIFDSEDEADFCAENSYGGDAVGYMVFEFCPTANESDLQ
jgi:hypothetical protein